jgi:hypothetical protein
VNNGYGPERKERFFCGVFGDDNRQKHHLRSKQPTVVPGNAGIVDDRKKITATFCNIFFPELY